MITGEDWIRGNPLNLKEARLMTTGLHAGEVEHKYDYSAMLSATPAWGWTSTTRKVGVFYVVPSLEYINGPPTKVELTGHIDLRDTLPADPTLLFIWHGSHYVGVPIFSGALIVVPEDAGQATATVTTSNIARCGVAFG